jgi:hypothetical protein
MLSVRVNIRARIRERISFKIRVRIKVKKRLRIRVKSRVKIFKNGLTVYTVQWKRLWDQEKLITITE